MAWLSLGFLCLCFMSLARTQKSVGSETLSGGTESFRELSSKDEEIATRLFKIMDKIADERVAINEYSAVWKLCDKDHDKHLSAQEVGAFLEANNLGPSSSAEQIFGNINLRDPIDLVQGFSGFDTDGDGTIGSSEFYSAYMAQIQK